MYLLAARTPEVAEAGPDEKCRAPYGQFLRNLKFLRSNIYFMKLYFHEIIFLMKLYYYDKYDIFIESPTVNFHAKIIQYDTV